MSTYQPSSWVFNIPSLNVPQILLDYFTTHLPSMLNICHTHGVWMSWRNFAVAKFRATSAVRCRQSGGIRCRAVRCRQSRGIRCRAVRCRQSRGIRCRAVRCPQNRKIRCRAVQCPQSRGIRCRAVGCPQSQGVRCRASDQARSRTLTIPTGQA